MNQRNRITTRVAELLPQLRQIRRSALVVAVWLGTATAGMTEETRSNLGVAASVAGSGMKAQLRQPAWNEPQAAATQVSRPLEVPGLQQPGFIAPAGNAKRQITPAKRGPNRQKPDEQSYRVIVPDDAPPVDKSSAASAPAGRPTLWQQFLGTNSAPGQPAAPPAGAPSARQQPTQSGPARNTGGRPENLAGQLFLSTAPTIAASDDASGGHGSADDRTLDGSASEPNGKSAESAPQWIPARQPSSAFSPVRTTGLLQQLAPAIEATESPAPVSDSADHGSTHAFNRASSPSATGATGNRSLPPGSIAPPNPTALAERAIGNVAQEGPLTSLWRPFAMTQDASMPSGSRTATTPENITASNSLGSGPTLEQTLENSIFLRPFYMTEVDPHATDHDSGMRSNVAAQRPGRSLESQLRSSSLMRQLALTTSGDLSATVDLLAESPLRSEQAAWDEGWMAQTPSIENPFSMTFDPNAPAGAAPEGDNAQLVAFMQEALPEPADLDTLRGNRPEPEAANGDAGGEDGDRDKADSLAEADRLGEEPEDNTLQFLRTATVLLKPGDSQWDIGFTYLFSENQFPILLADDMGNIIGVDDVDFRVRELVVPFEYRVGLLKRVQGFIGASVGWSNTEVSLDNFEAFENDGGFGDVNFGLTAQLLDATANCPYVITTVQATAPTGGDPFDVTAALAPSAPSLGQGFWSIAANLLFIQPYDPVVLFYGVGTEQFFSEEFRGIEFEPGAQYNYTLGVGFAVNERVTLSSRFFGAYVEELKADGVRLFNTNLEPMTMRFAATISKPCDRIVEPFVEFGLTDDSVSSFFGVTWTY